MIRLKHLLAEDFMAGNRMRTTFLGKKYQEASVLAAKQVAKYLIKKYGSIENVLVKHYDHADLRKLPDEKNDFADNTSYDEIKILPNGKVEFLQGFMGKSGLSRSGISDSLMDYLIYVILKYGPKKQ